MDVFDTTKLFDLGGVASKEKVLFSLTRGKGVLPFLWFTLVSMEPR